MAKVEVLLPQWGMGMSEGTIVTWLKAVGDHVDEDEALAEVETEKVTETLEAPVAGIVVELVADEGESIEVRQIVAYIETDD
jgi:pyruvate/2-oxoglutarate dehydrogenase complex dihydrolipoamide acyltransferase (E2) component